MPSWILRQENSRRVPLVPIRQLVSRSLIMHVNSLGPAQSMNRTMHFARAPIASGARVVLPNWYIYSPTLSSFTEQLLSGTTSFTWALEYPQGNIVAQATFGGSTTGTVNGLPELISDPLTLTATIPTGSQVFERVWASNSGGLPACEKGSFAACGDIGISGTTVTDQTMSSTITGVGADPQIMFMANAIIGPNNGRVFAFNGDSRTAGYADTLDASGDVGYCRALGANFPYIMQGISANQVQYYLASNTYQSSVVRRFTTDIQFAYGANDVEIGGRSLSQLQADAITFAGMFTQRIYGLTIPPESASSDNWETLVNQSPSGFGVFTPFNSWLLGVPAPFRAVFDVAGLISAPTDSTRWNVNGTPNWYTVEGVHLSQLANIRIATSGTIPANPA